MIATPNEAGDIAAKPDSDSRIAPIMNRPWVIFSASVVCLGSIWATIPWQTSSPWIATFACYMITQLLMVCVATDLTERRIPNWATYPVFALGLAVNVVAHFLPSSAGFWGAVGLGQSLGGGFGMLAIMLVIFSLSGGGAGDVKLSACLGAVLGWRVAVDAMLYSFIVAGAAMLCYAIWVVGPWVLVSSATRGVLHWFLPMHVDPPGAMHSEFFRRKLPLAPFFACGTALALYRHLPQLADRVMATS